MVDLDRGLVRVGGETISLRRKSFELLTFLTENAGRVVGKDELIEAVWPGVIVTEDSLTQAIRDVRRAIRDEDRKTLKTLPRRGYMLVVAHEGPAASSDGRTGTAASPPVVVIARPRVIGAEDGRNGGIAERFCENLAAALARFRLIFVRTDLDEVQAAGAAPAQPQADLIVSTTVERAPSMLRVTVGLDQTTPQRRVWTQTWETTADAATDPLGDFLGKVVNRIVTEIEALGARLDPAICAPHLRSFVHLTRGLALMRSYGPDVNQKALACFQAAAELDPNAGAPQAFIALAELAIAEYDLATRSLQRACRDRALRAIALSPDDHRCERLLGVTLRYLQEFRAAELAFRRALDLNPFDADCLVVLGGLQALQGQPEPALRHIDRAISLHSRHADWYHMLRARALFLLGRYREAAEEMEAMVRPDPWHHVLLASYHALIGNDEKAAEALATARQSLTDADILGWPSEVELLREEDRRHFGQAITAAVEAERRWKEAHPDA